jgi:hypothetical protein
MPRRGSSNLTMDAVYFLKEEGAVQATQELITRSERQYAGSTETL